MDKKISKKKLTEFGFLIGIGFPLFFGFIIPKLLGHDLRVWTIFVGIPTLLITMISPSKLFYFYKIWMKLGELLGFINSHLVLGIVYLIVLIPISIIMRIFGYDPLGLKKNFTGSYSKIRKEEPGDLTKIF